MIDPTTLISPISPSSVEPTLPDLSNLAQDSKCLKCKLRTSSQWSLDFPKILEATALNLKVG